jgi:hypothetical protein
LNKIQYLGKYRRWRQRTRKKKPEEDWHFTLLVSTGYVASALREAVSSLEPEALRQVEMTGLPALLPAFCRCNFLAFLLA